MGNIACSGSNKGMTNPGLFSRSPNAANVVFCVALCLKGAVPKGAVGTGGKLPAAMVIRPGSTAPRRSALDDLAVPQDRDQARIEG